MRAFLLRHCLCHMARGRAKGNKNFLAPGENPADLITLYITDLLGFPCLC